MVTFHQHDHYDHPDAKDEIMKLMIVQKCCKRAAEDEIPLRQIFDNVCRESASGGQDVAFSKIESSMYKQRRTAMPKTPHNSDEVIIGSHFVEIAQSPFYCGQVFDVNNDMALVFASDSQLDLLQPAQLIYVDSTFSVFIPFAGYSFPVAYAVMTRKTTTLYTAVLQRLHDLAPEFQPHQVIADYEEAPTAAVRAVRRRDQCVLLLVPLCAGSDEATKEAGDDGCIYIATIKTQVVYHCLLSLPLLPAADISAEGAACSTVSLR